MSKLTCSITVSMQNSTTDGPITFSSFSFLNSTGGGFSPVGVPYTVQNLIDSSSAEFTNVLYARGFGQDDPLDMQSTPTSGTAIFNMPNGDSLTIVWDLNALNDSNNVPVITPSSNFYTYGGIGTPFSSDGRNFVFQITVG